MYSSFLQEAQSILVDAVFPPRCAGCQAWSKALFCPTCAASLQRVPEPVCACCGQTLLSKAANLCAECQVQESRGFEALRSAYLFEGAMRQAIHRFKYEGKTALAEPLAEHLWQFLQLSSTRNTIDFAQIELLTPVPLHAWRRYRRGYNQSELLARELSKLSHIPFAPLVRRVRYTLPQVELGADHRKTNVQDAFALDAKSFKQHASEGKSVLLIDDVCTTGSTLRECAQVLKNAGAANVFAITLAR